MEFDSDMWTRREDRIIRYLRGELKGQELMDFQKDLKDDPELRSRTDRIRNLIKVAGNPQSAKVESLLLDLREKNIETIYSQMHPLKRRWHRSSFGTKVLAGLILLIVIVLSSFVAFNSKNADKLYGEYFMSYPPMVALAADQGVEKDAMTAYETGKLAEAIQKLEPLRKLDPVYELYYISASMKQQPDADSKNLELIRNFQNRFVVDDLQENSFDRILYDWADYYKALIYFKLGFTEIKEARSIVSRLSKEVDEGSLKEKVDALQKEIDFAFLY